MVFFFAVILDSGAAEDRWIQIIYHCCVDGEKSSSCRCCSQLLCDKVCVHECVLCVKQVGFDTRAIFGLRS